MISLIYSVTAKRVLGAKPWPLFCSVDKVSWAYNGHCSNITLGTVTSLFPVSCSLASLES